MSALSSQKYLAKNIDLKECILYNFRKNALDIRNIILGIDIFHDLMDNGIYCELVIADSVGLIEFLPIVGDETLQLKIGTPGFNEYRDYTFRVYKVSERKVAGERSEAYNISAVSQEVINNHRRSVKKSYKDLTADVIATKIYDEFLKPTEAEHYFVKKKNLKIQDSLQNLNLNFPGEKPFTAINMAAREGRVKSGSELTTYNFNGKISSSESLVDTSESSNFIFYESYDGWNFRTIDSLMQGEVFESFYLTEASIENQMVDNNSQGDTIKIHPRQFIENVSVVKQFNTIENIQTGLYNHEVETIDPILKKYSEVTFIYDRDSNNFSHLEKKPNEKLYADNSIFKSESPSSYKYFLPSNIGDPRQVTYVKEKVYDPFFANSAVETDQQIRNPRKLHEFLSFDVLSRVQLNNIVLSVTIPGNTDIEVGQIINLTLPQNTDVEEYLKSANLLFNKRFFITAVRHTINIEDSAFYTTIECVKDTYGKRVEEVKVKNA